MTRHSGQARGALRWEFDSEASEPHTFLFIRHAELQLLLERWRRSLMLTGSLTGKESCTSEVERPSTPASFAPVRQRLQFLHFQTADGFDKHSCCIPHTSLTQPRYNVAVVRLQSGDKLLVVHQPRLARALPIHVEQKDCSCRRKKIIRTAHWHGRQQNPTDFEEFAFCSNNYSPFDSPTTTRTVARL